jgi:catechol 2,3-dioxygenase-like lactoylglutathione lyase family enzyme
MKRTWTIIGVADVPQSFKWYQSLLGLPETAPKHDDFGQIVDSDGTVLLCLHEWGAHEHPSLTSPHYAGSRLTKLGRWRGNRRPSGVCFGQ